MHQPLGTAQGRSEPGLIHSRQTHARRREVRVALTTALLLTVLMPIVAGCGSPSLAAAPGASPGESKLVSARVPDGQSRADLGTISTGTGHLRLRVVTYGITGTQPLLVTLRPSRASSVSAGPQRLGWSHLNGNGAYERRYDSVPSGEYRVTVAKTTGYTADVTLYGEQ